MAGHPCCSCALCALRQPGLAAFFHVVVTLNLAVRACVTGPLWQDALRADLALCIADKDALRGEVAAAAAAITVLQRDRVRACKLGGWFFFCVMLDTFFLQWLLLRRLAWDDFCRDARRCCVFGRPRCRGTWQVYKAALQSLQLKR
jgi:hypothetical protein